MVPHEEGPTDRGGERRRSAAHPAVGIDPGDLHGGFQTASFIREAIASGAVDGVSIARSLVANNDLVLQWAAGADRPDKPCTYCNRCLVSAMKNPMGCYDLSRYPSREAMIDAVMSVYRLHADLVTPSNVVMSR